jgi:uncharacterized protein involved in exopolysaccharide biosynthesis
MVVTGSGGGSSPLERFGFNLADFGLQSFSVAGGMAAYPEILKSRSILDRLLDDRFQLSNGDSTSLLDVLHTTGPPARRREAALRHLRTRIRTLLDLDAGILTVRVQMPDPELSAQVLNKLTGYLLGYLVETSTGLAGKKSEFISERLTETALELAKREDALRLFRERNVRIGNSPALQMEEARLQRSLREQEEIYFALARQSEMAQLEQRQEVAPLAVLDPANVPATKHWPRRALLAGLGLLVGFVASAGFVLAKEG